MPLFVKIRLLTVQDSKANYLFDFRSGIHSGLDHNPNIKGKVVTQGRNFSYICLLTVEC